jgi:C-terminal processing protease CtpA/Prc
MQRNGRAKIFGERTMGLGGSVEEMEALTNSRVAVRLTRGLLTGFEESGSYSPANFIENNGVTPDIARPLSVDDVRGGYVGYVQAFSDEAARLVP